MFNAQEVLGQLMGAGMSPSSGRRIDNALGGQGGGGGVLGQILGGLQKGGAGSAGGGPLGGLGDLLRPQGGGSMPGGSTRIGSGAGGGAPAGGGGLGDLLGGLGGALGGQPGRSGGNPLAAGGLGALAGIFLGRGKSSMGNAVGGAGLAILGTLAMQALRKMGEQKSVEAQAQEMQAPEMQGRLPGRSAPVPDERIATEEDLPLGVRPPQTAGEEAVLASQAMILLQAMINAAKADGQIDGGEMQRIIGKLEEGGADGEARDFVLQEMRKPLDLDALVAQVQTPELAAEVYAASLLAIEVDTPAEQAYLQQLAQKLKLHPIVTQHLHQTLGVPSAA